MTLPGHRALAFARRWFDPATVHRVFEPLIADWQREWQDAPPSRRTRISIHGLAAFACALVVSSPQIAMASAPSTVTHRVVSRIATVTSMISLILLGPMLLTWMQGDMIAFALPGLLTLAFPFSLISAVDAIRCFKPLPEHVERVATAKLAVVAMVVMVGLGGWIVPAANIVMRSGMAAPRTDVSRGIRELNTYELIFEPSRATARVNPNVGHARMIRREVSTRASMAILPTVFIWLRWCALDRPRRKWYAPLPSSLATLAAFVGYIAMWSVGLAIELERILPYSLGMWVPTAGFIAVGFTARSWFRRRNAHDGLEAI